MPHREVTVWAVVGAVLVAIAVAFSASIFARKDPRPTLRVYDAATVDGLTPMPVGLIVPFVGEAVPEDWVECSGQAWDAIAGFSSERPAGNLPNFTGMEVDVVRREDGRALEIGAVWLEGLTGAADGSERLLWIIRYR